MSPRGGAGTSRGGAAGAPGCRCRGGVRRDPVVAGELEIRPDMFEAFVGGRSLGLTRREFELLQLLAAQPAG